MLADQLADLKLGELLDTPPPGLDEAVAIAKVRNLEDCSAGSIISCQCRSRQSKCHNPSDVEKPSAHRQ